MDGKRVLGTSKLRFWILCLMSTDISACGLSLLLKVSLHRAAVDRSKRRLIRLLMLPPMTSSSPVSPFSIRGFEELDSEGECGGQLFSGGDSDSNLEVSSTERRFRGGQHFEDILTSASVLAASPWTFWLRIFCS